MTGARAGLKRGVIATATFAALLTTAAWRRPASTGVSYDVRVTETVIDVSGRRSERVVLAGRTRTLGARARVDISTGNDEIRAGDYLLTNDGGRTLVVVSPRDAAYSMFSPHDVAARLASELKGRATVSDGRLDVDYADSEGERSATRRRITRAFRMNVRVMIVRRVKLEVHETSDYTIDPAMTTVVNPIVTYLAAEAAAPARLDPTLGAKITAAEEGIGSALVTRWEHRSVTREGSRSSETTTVMQASAVTPEPLSDDVFAIPAGFARRALP